MKKIAFALLIMVAACTSNKPKTTEPRKPIAVQQDGLETYLFKVGGLQDSIVADSIWKMILQYNQEIEKLVISKKDSSVAFTVNPLKMNGEMLAKEIERRGGKVLN